MLLGIYPTARPTLRPRTTSRPRPQRPCDNSPWGCCPDGITEAHDFYFSNCRGNINYLSTHIMCNYIMNKDGIGMGVFSYLGLQMSLIDWSRFLVK